MKTLKLFLTLLISISLSSCLEILEDVKINNDNSGTYKLIVNLSQSKGQIDKLMDQDSIQGKPVPSKDKINASINSLITDLDKQEGISNVIKTVDLDNFIFNISFDFRNIENLNLAVNNIIKSRNGKSDVNPVTYSFKSRQFSRILNSEILNQANKDKEKVSVFLTNFDLAKITSITRFESEIDKTDHSTAKISSNGKNCFEQLKINQILLNNNLHKHNITLK